MVGVNQQGEPAPVPDCEYLVYGDKQDSCMLRDEYLQTALEVSAVGDSAIYLLNPKVLDADGEWEAWFFADWLPGAIRYRSFREMMQGERDRFLALVSQKAVSPAAPSLAAGNAAKPARSGKAKPNPKKQAQKAAAEARRGNTESAVAALRQLSDAGEDGASASMAEIVAFQGDWPAVTTDGRVIRSLAVPGLGTGIGGMAHDEAAEQMRSAYDNVVGGKWRRITHAALAPYALPTVALRSAPNGGQSEVCIEFLPWCPWPALS